MQKELDDLTAQLISSKINNALQFESTLTLNHDVHVLERTCHQLESSCTVRESDSKQHNAHWRESTGSASVRAQTTPVQGSAGDSLGDRHAART